MALKGLTRDTAKPGMKVIVVDHPALNGCEFEVVEVFDDEIVRLQTDDAGVKQLMKMHMTGDWRSGKGGFYYYRLAYEE